MVDTASESIFPYTKWLGQVDDLNKKYNGATPFPHIILDDVFNPDALKGVISEFPDKNTKGWVHYTHVNEKKMGSKNNPDLFGPNTQAVLRELNSDQFVDFLARLTGHVGLFADPGLEGGGIQQSVRGGFLNIHTDFLVHPHDSKWRRRANMIVYLNENWEEDYGGDIELWNSDMTKCEEKAAPIFNRMLLFNTTEVSYHGHPEPLNCPDNMSRKTIALYYYTKEDVSMAGGSTDYKARPDDGAKAVWIKFDNWMLRVYHVLKGRLGISDNFVSKILRIFSKK